MFGNICFNTAVMTALLGSTTLYHSPTTMRRCQVQRHSKQVPFSIS